VRIRPLSTTELVDACEDVISFPAGNQLAIGGNTDKKPKSFSYDYVFPGHSGQEDIYTRCVRSQVQAFLGGYNATIFAYGQTGSGKTYTMGTASSVGLSREHVGIVPRVVADIFKKVEAKADTHDFEVKVVFLEIHNQSINDLLNPLAGNNSNKSAANSPNDQDEKRSHSHSDRNRSEGGPAIRELSNGEITVTGAVERVVASEEETLACLEQGTQCRCVCIYIYIYICVCVCVYVRVCVFVIASVMSFSHSLTHTLRVTGSTKMNLTSSRSHAIFTVYLTQTKKLATASAALEQQQQQQQGQGMEAETEEAAAPGSDDTLISKFHFVDLAGSERLKRTGAEGERMREGININKGLLALGNVISKLGDPSLRGTFVNYRDSKITRLLQDSLGGNSKTLMIACVSPASSNEEESNSTLQYANRARNIKNKAVKNMDRDAVLQRYKARIHELETTLRMYQSTGVPATSHHAIFESTLTQFNSQSAVDAQRRLHVAESTVQSLERKLKAGRERESTARNELVATQSQLLCARSLMQEQGMDLTELDNAGSSSTEEMVAKNLKLEAQVKQCVVVIRSLKQALGEQSGDQDLLAPANDSADEQDDSASGEEREMQEDEADMRVLLEEDPDAVLQEAEAALESRREADELATHTEQLQSSEQLLVELESKQAALKDMFDAKYQEVSVCVCVRVYIYVCVYVCD
jgi:hypothetical protein